MEKFENHLKRDLQPEKFEIKDLIYSSFSSDYLKTQYKNSNEIYFMRKFKLLPLNEVEIERELAFLEKISSTTPKPKIFPDYYGYFKEYSGNSLFYSLIFEPLPYNLLGSLEFQYKKKQNFPFATMKEVFTTILNGFALLQANNICPPLTNPSIFCFPNECQNIKFLDLGTHKDPKHLRDHYIHQLMKVKLDLHYVSPEAYELILIQMPNLSSFDPYKSEAFAFGLLILELVSLKPLKIQSNIDILKTEIQSHLVDFHENYWEKLKDEEEQEEFQGVYNILMKFLQIQIEDRWDFLDALKDRMVRKERLLYHIFLEESNLGEIQGIEWTHLRREPLKKSKEKEIKSIYQKDFAEYLSDMKSDFPGGFKKFDAHLLANGIEGVSLGNLNKENGQMLIYHLSEFLKITKSVQNVALWGNEEHFGKECLKAFCHGLKVNTSVQVLNLGDNGLGLKKNSIKGICKALRMNHTLTTLNLGGNKLGVSAKNLKAITKLMKINNTIQYLGLGSNVLGHSSDCMKLLCDMIKNNKTLISIGLPSNALSDDLDIMKQLCDALNANRTLLNLNLEYNTFGKNFVTFKLFCQTLRNQNVLKSVDLGNNFLGEKLINLELLCDTLVINKGLRNLGLGSNLIGKCKDGLKTLFEALKQNGRIETIELDGNGLIEVGEELKNLEDVFKKSKALNSVSMGDNQLERNKELCTFLMELEKKYGLSLKIL